MNERTGAVNEYVKWNDGLVQGGEARLIERLDTVSNRIRKVYRLCEFFLLKKIIIHGSRFDYFNLKARRTMSLYAPM